MMGTRAAQTGTPRGIKTNRSSRESLLSLVWRWHERWLQRRALEELTADRLRDIGVTRAQAVAEARKPFWRP